MENVFIGICGIIGAGKTTLAKNLGRVLDLPVYCEEVIENEYLSDFYADMKRYAFPLQIHLLNRRFKQHQQIIWQGRGGIQDRTIYEDSVFAKMLMESGMMEERDYRCYVELFGNMSNFMRKPNVIVYLEVTAEQSQARIKQRAREMEAGIPLDYLRSLAEAYESFIRDISRVVPVIRVDWNEIHDPEETAERIKQEYERIQIVHSVDWQHPVAPLRDHDQ